MNTCLRGKELLLDLQRSDFLPPWDEEGVRTVSNEIINMYSKLITDSNDDEAKVNNAYYGHSILRNKRYLLSYILHRCKKFTHLRWEVGTVIPDVIRQDILSARENDFFGAYCENLTELCNNIGLDLASDLEPPKELFIEVRALQNCGEIMTENGPLNIEKGSTHHLRRSDVEMLILQGKLKHIDSDDG